MKGKAMERMIRKWESRRSGRVGDEDDDLHPPLLQKRSRHSSSENALSDSDGVSCVSFAKRPKNLVTVLVGKERQVFKVEPQILEHALFQCLLQKTRAGRESAIRWDDKENNFGELDRRRKSYSVKQIICLDCDAILFEHLVWLLNNDDPAVRQLNIDELMEFYE